jgi:hypothetical protein
MSWTREPGEVDPAREGVVVTFEEAIALTVR